jgi:hypothetical protein
VLVATLVWSSVTERFTHAKSKVQQIVTAFGDEVRFHIDKVTVRGLSANVISPSSIQMTNDTNEIYDVPYDWNGFFTGRDNELVYLGQKLAAGIQQQNACVIHSMGGVGKTQLALTFCFLNRQSFHWIFWLSAENLVELAQKFAGIGKRLTESKNRSSPPSVHTQAQYIQMAKQNLETTSKVPP